MKSLREKLKNKNKNNNITHWSFDKIINVEDFQDRVPFFSKRINVFTKDECDEIIKLDKKLDIQQGLIGKGLVEDIRMSNIAWIPAINDYTWIYDRLTKLITAVNDEEYKFDISGMERIQFTKYLSPSGKYEKHTDSGYLWPSTRKLSISVQLSESTDYEGGNLLIHAGGFPEVMSRVRQTAIIFPSYRLHEVTPVTSGVRYSLVAWATGKPFK